MNIISMKPAEIIDAWAFAMGTHDHAAFDAMLDVIEVVQGLVMCSKREAAELAAWLGCFRAEQIEGVTRDDLYRALGEVRREFERVYCGRTA